MAQEKSQSLQNHVRHDKMLYFYAVLLLLGAALAATGIVLDPVFVAVAVIVNTLATLFLAVNARGYGLAVQNRVIRLEMRLRLKELLSPDLALRIPELTLGQLVALRFASDAELPALTKKVLDEKITDRTEIKKLIKDWQPDFMRV